MRAPRSALASDTLGGHIPIVALASVAALPLDRDRVGDDTVEGNGDQDGLPHDPGGRHRSRATRSRSGGRAGDRWQSARSSRKRVVRRRRDADPGRPIAGTGGAGHHSGRRQYALAHRWPVRLWGFGRSRSQGFGQPIRASCVVGDSAAVGWFEARQLGGRAPLVGRAVELEVLFRSFWNEAVRVASR